MVSERTYWSERKLYNISTHVSVVVDRIWRLLSVLQEIDTESKIKFTVVGWLVFQSLLQSLTTKLEFRVFTRVSESNQYIANS